MLFYDENSPSGMLISKDFVLSSKSGVQGQPLGFDTKYLALADRNMQVRFSLKVVRES